MATRKVKKDFWEQLFKYPSFNHRFGFTVGLILVFFIAITIAIFKLKIVSEISDQISILNLIVQLAVLVLGILAAYYALRQLVETRFINLDEAAMQELKRNHYSRAVEKWREAFYIRPEAAVFINMCEGLLLVGDYDTFDQYIRMSESSGFMNKEIIQESSDQIILMYLRAIRHLLVKNQGEAEKHTASLITLVQSDKLLGFQWDFLDLQRSPAYQDLSGECKNISENLISYLSRTIQPTRRTEFESGKYATQAVEPVAQT